MRTENQSNGRAHGCDHAQIFCAHGLIHAHRKSRVIGVRMAMCTSTPIFGKHDSWEEGGGAVKEPSVHDAYLCVCVYVSKDIHVCSFQSGRLKIQIWQCSVLKERRAGSGLLKQFFWGQRAFWGF